MRLLLDEHVSSEMATALRAAGYDTRTVREACLGAKDTDVLAFAQTERRVLITFDKGFGRLVFQQREPAHAGVILFRDLEEDLLEDPSIAVEKLSLRHEWGGVFAVISHDEIRIALIPFG